VVQPVDLGPKAPLRPRRSSGESAVIPDLADAVFDGEKSVGSACVIASGQMPTIADAGYGRNSPIWQCVLRGIHRYALPKIEYKPADVERFKNARSLRNQLRAPTSRGWGSSLPCAQRTRPD
jgi:hypothetical protein